MDSVASSTAMASKRVDPEVGNDPTGYHVLYDLRSIYECGSVQLGSEGPRAPKWTDWRERDQIVTNLIRKDTDGTPKPHERKQHRAHPNGPA